LQRTMLLVYSNYRRDWESIIHATGAADNCGSSFLLIRTGLKIRIDDVVFAFFLLRLLGLTT